jgi:hypothetical protein
VKFCYGYLFVLLISCACRKEPTDIPDRALYYWKHEYRITPFEDSTIQSLGIKKIYVKFFDVTETDHGIAPITDIAFDPASLKNTASEIIPVVFITQSAILNTNDSKIRRLASQIYAKITRMAYVAGIHFREIQIDCDWASHSRDKFFSVIENMKPLLGKKDVRISCTIHLHQIKYKDQSGIPPCDRGMLMFYNMTDWRKENTKNSIFDAQEAEKYLPYIKDYPMKLDVALPIFRWAIAYRDHNFLAILGGADNDSFSDKIFFTPQGSRYLVLRDTFAFGAALKAGDIIRVESCDVKTIAEYSKRISKLLPDEHRSFALYHLDSSVLSHYSHDDLESLFPH